MSNVPHRYNTCLKRKSLALAIAAMVIGIPFTASGQDTDQGQTATSSNPANSKTTTLQTITVTGSLIPRTSIETPSPVQVISIAKIKAMGFVNVADVVQSISANNSGSVSTKNDGNFAVGASGVALRGLTVSGTLVLVDGHRVADYPLNDDGERSFVDLNTIPMEAVDRIEVLKDSASSLYGADAVAGVVNIILRSNYQGGEVHTEIGDSQHGGGFEKRVTGSFGKGDLQAQGYNAYLDFSYDRDNSISTTQRGFPFNTSNQTQYGLYDGRAGDPSNFSGSNYAVVAPATLRTPGDILTGVQIPGTLFQPLAPCGPNSETTTEAGVGTYCAQDNTRLYSSISPQLAGESAHPLHLQT